jgi:O-antigen ligase
MSFQSIRYCNYIIEIGIILLIIFSPLAFGSVEVWAYSIIILGAIFLTIVWLIKIWLKNRLTHKKSKQDEFSFRFNLYKAPLNLPIILFIMLIVIQLIPFPKNIVHFISPNTQDIYSESNNLLKNLPLREKQSTIYYTFSLSPNATKEELYKLIGYALIFFLILNNIKRPAQLKKIMLTIVILAFCISLFAIIQKAFWNGKIYWFRELRYGGKPFGPYVNSNHYAGFMEMAIPLALAALITTRSINKKIIYGFMAIVMASTIFLSLSRGGMLSFLGSLFTISLILFFHKSFNKHQIVIILLLIGIFMFILYLQFFSAVSERFLSLIDVEGISKIKRPLVWKDTLNIVKDFPLLGTGLGTFRYIFPKYKSSGEQILFLYAENDYLQVLSEAGFIGFFIIVWGVFIVTLSSFKTIAQDKLAIFFFGSIAAILIHSFFDFNLHIPANALIFSIILGMNFRLSNKENIAIRP